MALQKCHECGKDVSDEAKSCPSCGAKVKKVKKPVGPLGITFCGLLLVAFISAGMMNAENRSAPAPQVNIEQGLFRNVAGDQGKYYLLEKQQQKNGNWLVLHKRVSPQNLGFTKTEINCKTIKFKVISYGDDAIENMKPTNDRWADIVQGSSKSDLIKYVCK